MLLVHVDFFSDVVYLPDAGGHLTSAHRPYHRNRLETFCTSEVRQKGEKLLVTVHRKQKCGFT